MRQFRWKGRKLISAWSLLPVAAGALGVSVLLSACGGGGGGGGGAGNLGLSMDDARVIVLASAALFEMQMGYYFEGAEEDILFSRPPCAQVSRNGEETIVDFGDGCASYNRTYAGRVRYRVEGLDVEDKTYSRLSLTFENFRINREEPSMTSFDAVAFNGTYTKETLPSNRYVPQRVVCDLTMRVNPTDCAVRIRLDTGFTYEGDWIRSHASMNFVSPATGDLTLNARSTMDKNRTDCPGQPISGSSELRYKGRTLIVSYDNVPCGKVRATFNGKTQLVDPFSFFGDDSGGDDDEEGDDGSDGYEYLPASDPCVQNLPRS